MQNTLIAVELHIFQKKLKKRIQEYHSKYLQNTSRIFNNVWILLCWIHLFYKKGTKLIDYTNLFSPNEYELIILLGQYGFTLITRNSNSCNPSILQYSVTLY